jgi:hypothetical protein
VTVFHDGDAELLGYSRAVNFLMSCMIINIERIL